MNCGASRSADPLRKMFMPPEGVKMSGYDPIEPQDLRVDKSRFQR